MSSWNTATVAVNFTVNLTGSQGVQIFDETWFLSISGRVFLDEISVCMTGLSKVAYLLQCSQHLAICGRPPQLNKKVEKGRIWSLFFNFFAWAGTLICCPVDSHLSSFWTQFELYQWLSQVSSFRWQSWDLSASIIVWASFS